MGVIEKDYFTLPEIMERWAFSRPDIVYLAENGKLRLSVRVFGLGIERGCYEETDDGRWFSCPYERTGFSGVLDIHDHDAFVLFRDGAVEVHAFHAGGNEYITLLDGLPPLTIHPSEILVRKDERDRFEAEELGSLTNLRADSLEQSNNYRVVRIGRDVFHLGELQARVIALLHQAAQSDQPWCLGKLLLHDAGSQGTRMVDLFKSKPGWRRLIASNGRGQYRLNIPQH